MIESENKKKLIKIKLFNDSCSHSFSFRRCVAASPSRSRALFLFRLCVCVFFCLLLANVLTQKFKNGAKSKLPNFTHRCSFSIFYSRLITNIVLLLFQPILIFRKYPRLKFFFFAFCFIISSLYFYEYLSTSTANTNTSTALWEYIQNTLLILLVVFVAFTEDIFLSSEMR